MPAHILFGRKIRLGSDDFAFPALLCILYQLSFLMVGILYLGKYKSCSTMEWNNSGLPFWMAWCFVILFSFMIIVEFLILRTSLQGTIVASYQRYLLSPLIGIFIVFSIMEVVLGGMGVYLTLHDHICHSDSSFIIALSLAALILAGLSFTFSCCICTVSKPLSRQHTVYGEMDGVELPTSDMYNLEQVRMERNCRRLCFCIQWLTCNLFGGSGTKHDSISIVALVLARFFYGSPDIVLSDVVAGFVLLSALQSHEVLIKRNELTNIKTIECRDDDDDQQQQQQQQHFRDEEVLDSELRDQMKELAHYSHYAIGMYGWKLYLWSHPYLGFFRLFFNLWKRFGVPVRGDNFLRLNQTSFQIETKLQNQDILYSNFCARVCEPPFTVALDHKKKTVVIAIRGTLSLEDCLTDVIADTVPLDEYADETWDLKPGGLAHQGMLHAADWIHRELQRTRVLDSILYPSSISPLSTPFTDYQLRITGHSLGAGTAVLLSILLKPKFPDLHCYAFSPPGCVLSSDLAKQTEGFVTSCIVGKDIVASASLTSMETLRDKVLDLIGRSKLNKSTILRKYSDYQDPKDLFYGEGETPASAFGAELEAYRLILVKMRQARTEVKMSLPGRIIHLTKSDDLASPSSSLFCCCRSGVCCTDRTNYYPTWSDGSQFREIRIARTMWDDHFPDKVHEILQVLTKQDSLGG